ncbi:hypothetical protein D9M69_583140 [compost metagenome]
MNVDGLTKEDRVVKFLTRAEVLGAFFHEQGVDPLVGGRKAHAHAFESICAENGVADGRGFRTAL